MLILSTGRTSLVSNWCLDGFSCRPSALSLGSLLSSESLLAACQRHLTQRCGDSTPQSGGVILATLSPLIKPSVYRLHLLDTFVPSLPSFPLLFLPLLPPPAAPRSHPPPLCPLTTWHLFRFIPISWQTACISTRGAQCSDPRESMADKSMLSLFSMPLPPSIFFFFFFFFLLLCCLWRLELCSIKLSSLSGTNCSSVRLSARETDTNVSSGRGVRELYLWDAPFEQELRLVFTEAEPGFIGIVNPLSDEARWRLFLDSEVFHFELQLIPKTETKQNTLWSYLPRTKEPQLACE